MKRALWIVGAMALWMTGSVLAGGKDCAAAAAAEKVEKQKCEATTQECLDHMAAHFRDRGWVGIELAMNEETGAMTVSAVEPNSPAIEAGFKKGDVLVALNGVRLDDENKEKVYAAKEKMTIGTTVTYTVDRGGKEKDLPVTLAQIPEATLAKWIGHHMIEGHSPEGDVAVAQKD